MGGTNRQKIIARTLAGMIAALGAYLIIGWIIVPFSKNSPTVSGFGDILFFFIFPVPVLAFSFYCIFAAYRLWSKVSPENVRRILFIISVFIFLFLITLFRRTDKKDVFFIFSIPLLMIPAGLFYIVSIGLFLRLLALPTEINWTQHEKSARRYFGWFSFFLIISSFELASIFLPLEKTDTTDFKALLVLPVSILIIVLALVIYKSGVKIALTNKPKEDEITAYPKANNPLSPPDQ
jgi:hypothetical protein